MALLLAARVAAAPGSVGGAAAPASVGGAAAAGSVGGAAAPRRIVSINPCIDAILMHVADPGQIAAISHYSKDVRASSIPPAQAARFAATSGTAEEIVALAPDLVLTGPHVEPATVAALRRLRIPLVQVPVPETIGQSREQVMTVARSAGQPQRGAALVARIDAAVMAARSQQPPVDALIWQGGGLVPGSATLADELLRTSGFRNKSADYGLASWDVLPLEPLLADPPRVLLTMGAPLRVDRMLGHPAMKQLAGQVAVRSWPERLLQCGGPTIIDAVDQLAAIRKSL